MSDLNLARLREVAEGATRGEWELDANPLDPERWGEGAWGPHQVQANGDADCVVAYFDDLPDWMPDATHIATFDPPTVLALIAEVERLREACGHLLERDEARGCVKLERDHHRETLRQLWYEAPHADQLVVMLDRHEPWLRGESHVPTEDDDGQG